MNLSDYKEKKPNYIKRLIWILINYTLFRLMIGSFLMKPRNTILRLFGAKIDKKACVYNTCIIFAPWNLDIGRACIGPRTHLYCKDHITIGDDCCISQGSYLCTASHSIESIMLPLVTKPIIIKDKVWIAANCFIGMGVRIGEGAVVGAATSVFKNVEPWTVVGGNPARFLKKRVLKDE